MLIRFSVENFLSFDTRTEFNMLTGDDNRLPNHVHKLKKVSLVRSSVIYGANGAGKSNMMLAFQALSESVLEGGIVDLGIENVFKFSKKKNYKCQFEIEFIQKGIGYAYGLVFDIDTSQIVEEWLYKLDLPHKNDQLVFERSRSKNGKSKMVFAPNLIKDDRSKLLLSVLQEDFLENDVPFLSIAKNKKFKDITNAYEWFMGAIIVFPKANFTGLASYLSTDDEFSHFCNDLISKLDIGITSIEVITMSLDSYFGEDDVMEKERVIKALKAGEPEVRLGDYPNIVTAILEDELPVVKKVVSYHENNLGEKIKFELVEESDGTLRLFDFLPVIYLLTRGVCTIFIDEIDQSIHPFLLKELIRFLQDGDRIKGQIIFTSHEANLLDLEIFRSDEIWFAEKNQGGATSLYTLNDYDVSQGFDVRKGYLSGRFGAIPFLANLNNLNWN